MKLEKGGGSQNVTPTCVNCVKRHYGECLRVTGSLYGCGKEGQKVRDCPTIASRGRVGNKVAINVPKDDVQATRHMYALRIREEKSDGGEDDEGNPWISF